MNPAATSATAPQRAVVIVLRGLGPAHIGGYGNEWIRTPNLDRLCARSYVFDRHYATTTDLAKARVDWSSQQSDLLPAVRSAGVTTIHIGNMTNGPETGDWQVAESVPREPGRPWSLLPIRRRLYELLAKLAPKRAALVWVEADVLAPPWMPPRRWVKYYHSDISDDGSRCVPWTDPLPDRVSLDDHSSYHRLQYTFGAGVSGLDASLGKLLAGLRRHGLGRESLLILTSDLGFPLGEHGAVGRSATDIQESLVHLPLIVRLPGQMAAGHRVEALTQPSDVGETIAAHFGMPKEPSSSLFPLLRDHTAKLRDHIVIFSIHGKAIRTHDQLLMQDNQTTRMFHQPSDRWHVHDIAGNMTDESERLKQLLNQAAT